jgi:addiction module RelE/StbE family toxin
MGFIVHRSFEKSYERQIMEVKDAFRERRNLLLIDPEHPLLNNHPLHGKWKGRWSINVTGDIRAIYKMEGFIAIFLEIGSHGQLYR